MFEQNSKLVAKMEARVILFSFLGVDKASIVFLTYENIEIDTKIAGLARI